MSRIRIQIDASHASEFIRGKTIAIKIPKDAEILEIKLAEPTDSLVKLFDMLFNGRKA